MTAPSTVGPTAAPHLRAIHKTFWKFSPSSVGHGRLIGTLISGLHCSNVTEKVFILGCFSCTLLSLTLSTLSRWNSHLLFFLSLSGWMSSMEDEARARRRRRCENPSLCGFDGRDGDEDGVWSWRWKSVLDLSPFLSLILSNSCCAFEWEMNAEA